jgi:hypothetical protein
MKRSALLLGMLILSARTASAQDRVPCNCGNGAQAVVCLTETQMSAQVKHIEMQPDRMGNHVKVGGVAVFALIVDKGGRVLKTKAISGHPLAVPRLIGTVDKWRFKPLMRDGVAHQTCGRLSLKFSTVENQSKVEIARP